MSDAQQVTGPMRRVWNDAADSDHDITEALRLMTYGHGELEQVIDVNLEQPSIEQVRAQAIRALNLVSAARRYQRDLRKLYALTGGDVRTDIEAANE